MDFTKIRWDGQRVHLAWLEEQSDSTRREVRYVCSDPPHEDFELALALLARPVAELLELDEDWVGRTVVNERPNPSAQFHVTGLTLSRQGGDERLGVVVTCQRQLFDAPAPLVLNTPQVTEAGPSSADGAAMSPDLLAGVTRVIREAERYLGGHRAQASLFAEAAE